MLTIQSLSVAFPVRGGVIQRYLADQMIAISLGVESMFYPYNTKDYTNWSFRSGNGAFSYDTWFTLKTR